MPSEYTTTKEKGRKKPFLKNTEPTQNADSNKEWVQMLSTLSLAKWTMEYYKKVNNYLPFDFEDKSYVVCCDYSSESSL